MLTGPDDSNRLDRAVVLMAVVMAVHCLAAASLDGVLPALTGRVSHQVLAGVVVLLSGVAIINGCLEHREIRPAGWAIPGWFALGIAHFSTGPGLSEFGEIMLTVSAATSIIVAHQLNRSLAYWRKRL